MYTANQEFSWAHGGVRVQTFARGEQFVTDDPELIRVATEQGWIGGAHAAGAAQLPTVDELLLVKGELERRTTQLDAMRDELEAQAERQRDEDVRLRAESDRQAAEAAALTAECARLEAMAKSLEQAKATPEAAPISPPADAPAAKKKG